MMEQMNTEEWGSVRKSSRICVCVCVCVCVVGELSVSGAAVSPPRLSLITVLTPQEALDVRLAS